MFGFSPAKTVLLAAIITAFYSMLGGLLGVLITDFFQFLVAMAGSVAAAVIALRLPQVGGLHNLLTHERVSHSLSLLPDFSNSEAALTVLIIPLAVQWWSVWYPGAEPGGGGYIAQRMLAAKNEKHAMGATLLFNACHYALRPWPWIIVALASMIVFPDLASLRAQFPRVDPSVVKNDLAYSAMLTFLPSGVLGIVVASLIAAYMSTISTHLNWGSSYVVNDFWRRFYHPNASEKELVNVGRASTFLLMVFAAILSLFLSNALQAFNIMLQIGAGTGLLFILRWFWWRINAASEIAAMVISFFVAIYFQLIHTRLGYAPLPEYLSLIIGVAITTVGWLVVTFLTRPTDEATLRHFYSVVYPGGPGWEPVLRRAKAEGKVIEHAEEGWDVPLGILCMVFGCFAIYGALFATGYWIYGKTTPAVVLSVVAVVATVLLTSVWGKLKAK
jgi:Na+/proline symporter